MQALNCSIMSKRIITKIGYSHRHDVSMLAKHTGVVYIFFYNNLMIIFKVTKSDKLKNFWITKMIRLLINISQSGQTIVINVTILSPITGNTKGGSITVPLTSYLTGLD